MFQASDHSLSCHSDLTWFFTGEYIIVVIFVVRAITESQVKVLFIAKIVLLLIFENSCLSYLICP